MIGTCMFIRTQNNLSKNKVGIEIFLALGDGFVILQIKIIPPDVLNSILYAIDTVTTERGHFTHNNGIAHIYICTIHT